MILFSFVYYRGFFWLGLYSQLIINSLDLFLFGFSRYSFSIILFISYFILCPLVRFTFYPSNFHPSFIMVQIFCIIKFQLSFFLFLKYSSHFILLFPSKHVLIIYGLKNSQIYLLIFSSYSLHLLFFHICIPNYRF